MDRSKSDIITYERMFGTINFVQDVLGITELFRKVENINSWRHSLKRMYFILLFINMIYSVFSSMYMSFDIIIKKEKDKYFESAELMPCAFIAFLVDYKLVHFFFNSKYVVALLEDLKDSWIEDNSSEEIKKIVYNNLRPVIRLVNFYSIHTAFNIATFFITPFLIDYLFPKPVRVIPFKMYYPFNYQESNFRYAMVLISQFGCVYSMPLCMAILDCFIITIIALMAMHFDVLSQKLRELPKLTMEPSPEEQLEINKGINLILKKHIHLIGTCDLAQQILGPVFLFTFGLSSLLICQLLFIISIAPVDKQMNFVGMLASMLVQVFLMCYYGDKMVEKSLLMCDAAYEVDWYCGNVEFKSKIRILQQRTQNPVMLTTYGFAAVALPTFSSILNTSYSYFTLLKTASAGADI